MWSPLVKDWYGWWAWWIPLWIMFYWTIAKGCSSEATRERDRDRDRKREREEHDKPTKRFFLTLLFLYFCIISVQVLCDKVRGEGGEAKIWFCIIRGEGGVWRGAKLYYIILEWSLTGITFNNEQWLVIFGASARFLIIQYNTLDYNNPVWWWTVRRDIAGNLLITEIKNCLMSVFIISRVGIVIVSLSTGHPTGCFGMTAKKYEFIAQAKKQHISWDRCLFLH